MEINYKTKKLTEVNDLCIDKKDLGCVFYIELENVGASFLVTHYDTDFQMTNLESWITYSLTDFKEKFGYAYAERWIIESITLK